MTISLWFFVRGISSPTIYDDRGGHRLLLELEWWGEVRIQRKKKTEGWAVLFADPLPEAPQVARQKEIGKAGLAHYTPGRNDKRGVGLAGSGQVSESMLPMSPGE